MPRILFLAANPIDQQHLRIRQERTEIRRVLDLYQPAATRKANHARF
jgi:hypothetical protein